MFIPDDCPHLVDIKKSLPKHKRELYKELETPKIERGYQWFLQALLSKAEEQLKNEREQVIDISEDDKDDDDKDPQSKYSLRNSSAIEGEKVGQVKKRSRKVVDGGNVGMGKNVRQKKKETDDDVEILDPAAVSEGNLSPFVPSSMNIGDVSEYDGFSNERSEFRKNILNSLKKPYDEEEHHKRLEAIEDGLYLTSYPDLREELVKNKYSNQKCLTILRGFFFWLQNLTQKGAFKPWTDRECLAMEPESH